jgi:phosphoglucosamine mutase
VKELRADVGIALDGDADRVIIIDERGEIFDGDMLMWLCARNMKERGELKNDTVVATVMSNLGLERALDSIGVDLVRTQVGDRYVVEAMREGGYNLGGEQSGHILFLDHSTTGDGMMSALQVLALMVRKGAKLSDLNVGFDRLPQALVNIGVAEKRPIEDLASFQDAVAEIEDELGETGRVLIRYSGTENKARVMVEGRDESRVHEIANQLASKLKRALAGEG